MRKMMLCGAAVLIVALVAFAGGDPWKTKPYTEWTDEDIQKVFTGSPWAKTVAIEGTWKPVSATEAATGAQTSGGGGKGMGGTATVLPAEADPSAGTRGPNVSFNVYWMSSETIRAGLARRGVLHGGKDPAEAQKFVEAPQDEYQVAVQGPDMAPFYHQPETFYQANASLEIKKTKQKIQPSHVTYGRDAAGKINSAIFYFPKKANGQDTISAEDKNVEFSCKLGASTLHADFEPSKMVNAKGSDL